MCSIQHFIPQIPTLKLQKAPTWICVWKWGIGGSPCSTNIVCSTMGRRHQHVAWCCANIRPSFLCTNSLLGLSGYLWILMFLKSVFFLNWNHDLSDTLIYTKQKIYVIPHIYDPFDNSNKHVKRAPEMYTDSSKNGNVLQKIHQESELKHDLYKLLRYHVYRTQKTQNICIAIVQRRPNVFDVGPTLYKCYTNVFCLLQGRQSF